MGSLSLEDKALYQYRSYHKNFASTVPLTIRGSGSDHTLRRLQTWFLDIVAPAYKFLMPAKKSVEYAYAVENLMMLDLLEVLWMLACLQESHNVPAFPQTPLQTRAGKSIPYTPMTAFSLGKTNYVPRIFAVVPSRQPKARLGVVSMCSEIIPSDELVGRYLGKIMTTQKGRRLADKKYNKYIMLVEQHPRDPLGYCINARAREEATFTRFINEARPPMISNVCYRDNGHGGIEVTTMTSIRPGAELLTAYKCKR